VMRGQGAFHKQRRAERNEKIADAYARGEPPYSISRWANISADQIKAILRARWDDGRGDKRCAPHTEQQIDEWNARVYQPAILKQWKRHPVETIAKNLKISVGAVKLSLYNAAREGKMDGIKVGGG
jgi:hypothetical protein